MTDLARGFCPHGEHRTKTVPVVCVDNKQPATPVSIERVMHTAWALALIVGVVMAAFLLWREWRRGRAPKGKPIETAGALPLGPAVTSATLGSGDLGWTGSSGAVLPRDRLNLHVLVAGATGSGKSTTVDRIELEAVRTYRPQLIHFDCKGRRDGAARFLAIMLGAGYDQDEIRVAPVEPYDGWRGDARAHLNRLLAVQDFSESQPYYTAGTKDLLQQAIPDGPVLPRFADELIERLQRERGGIDPKVATGALGRYRGFFTSLNGLLDGSWAFDDVEACYVELPGMARREDAIAFGRYLLEDFMHYIAERKDPDREVLLVLDDFSAISTGDEAVNLIERAREFGVGVVLTTQSYSGLGPGRDRIMDACNGAFIVHRMSDPEPFVARAGTVWRETVAVSDLAHRPGVISSIIFKTSIPEGPRVTRRQQEFRRIDANEVRSLPPGDAFMIAEGRAQLVRIKALADLDVVKEIPLIGPTSLVEMARANLAGRKELSRDLNPPSRSTVPEQDADPDLDF